ncbi:MAG: type-F conjugative transfer system pilin assembly protein TrbC [Sulfuricaulis sp.]
MLILALNVMADGTPNFPTDTDIKRQQLRAMPMPDDSELQSMMGGKQNETQKAFERITPAEMQSASKAFPKIDTPKQGADLEAIANRFNDLQKPKNSRTSSDVYVFVTMSMPTGSLDRIISDAEKARSTIVIRGLVGGSFKSTVKYIADLARKRNVAFEIDPNKFKLFGVNQAPTTVVVVGDSAASEGGCVGKPPKFYSVEGDVSLEYALEYIVDQRPDSQTKVDPYMRRLTGEE